MYLTKFTLKVQIHISNFYQKVLITLTHSMSRGKELLPTGLSVMAGKIYYTMQIKLE